LLVARGVGTILAAVVVLVDIELRQVLLFLVAQLTQ
jgi:hypothetical protein